MQAKLLYCMSLIIIMSENETVHFSTRRKHYKGTCSLSEYVNALGIINHAVCRLANTYNYDEYRL